MIEVTFTPTVTLTEQPDGSFVATFDWSSCLSSVFEVNRTEDIELPEAYGDRAADALDAFLKDRPVLAGFTVPAKEA